MTIFLGLITAHILADFVMQSGFKEKRTGADLLGHIVAVSAMTAIVLCGLQYWGTISFSSAKVLAGVIVGIGIVHAAQDVAGANLGEYLRPYITQLTGLVIDQVLHVAVLLGVGTLLCQQQVVAIASTSVGTYGWQAELALRTVLLAAFATSVAAVVIAYLLEPFAQQLKLPSDSKMLNAGLWIGVCERFLLVLAIASGSELFPSVGFVLTAKSIFRFRELENRVHAEYYLLGTLMSISVAVFIGLILRAMYS